MEVVREAQYSQAFTFIYSPREGTPAATWTSRYRGTSSRSDSTAWSSSCSPRHFDQNLPFVGTVQEVLIEGASKRDDRVLTGRTPSNKVVHVPAPEGRDAEEFAGRIVKVRIDEAQTWFLAGELVEQG